MDIFFIVIAVLVLKGDVFLVYWPEVKATMKQKVRKRTVSIKSHATYPAPYASFLDPRRRGNRHNRRRQLGRFCSGWRDLLRKLEMGNGKWGNHIIVMYSWRIA
jgi:hypothetical protein